MRERIVYILIIVILSVGSVYVWQKMNVLKDFYDISKTENGRLSQQLSEVQFDLENRDKEIILLKKADVKKFDLIGDLKSNVNLAVTVYQSQKNGKVWVIVNKPFALEPEKKFQLWGIINDEYLNTGQFQISLTGLQYLKELPIMESFTITIEDIGKNTTPTGKPVVITTEIK